MNKGCQTTQELSS